MELKKLIKKRESQTMEFKQSLRLDEVGENVSAFSNTNKGLILVGVSDSGEIKGVQIGRKTVEDLANYIKQHTDNPIYPKIKVETSDGKNIIAIEVDEHNEKPVFFRGEAYGRVGKSVHKLSASEIRKLAKKSTKSCWDEQICEGAASDDIDWEFVKETFIPLYEKISEKKVEGKSMDLLKSLGCIKKGKPTNAGILLFGKNPQKFFMNSYIALGRYKGKQVFGEKLDYKEFKGNLFQQIDGCNNYLVEHTALMSKLIPGEVRRKDIPEYGRFSVRELITNAICHRDYEDQGGKIIIKVFDDRIEFYNIGGLPEWITPENITSEQYSRNPVIAKILAKVEYIEELGEGWDKIIKEHKEHFLNPKMPEIKSSKNSTLVSLFSTKEKFEEEKYDLNERQRFVLDYLKSEVSIRSMHIQKKFDVTRDTANRDINELIKLALIKREGIGKAVRYKLK